MLRGFAGAGRTNHEQIVAVGRGDFERALGAFLPFDVSEAEQRSARFQNFRLRPRQHLRALEMIGELDQRACGDNLDFRAGPGRFGSASGRADQAVTTGIGPNGGRQDAGDGCDRTVKAELAEHGEVRERRDQLTHPPYQKPELLATAPNQLWSWDITKLLGPVKWTYFYLYVLLDVFSRYVTGWMVAMRESAELAKRLIEESCKKQGIRPGQLTLHADRGTSMTSKPVGGELLNHTAIGVWYKPRQCFCHR